MPEFTQDTTGDKVVAFYANRVPGKTSEFLQNSLKFILSTARDTDANINNSAGYWTK